MQNNPTQTAAHDQADAAKLLSDFITSGRSEGSFQQLVDELGKLVFSSALRRTGDPSLAEEVTQNVFTSLARHASALQSHPSLLAWIFKTTRFEASKALRTERRRQRKHDELAAETQPANRQSAMDQSANDESWLDAVPHLDASLDQLSPKDRQAVLQRFYEGKKFSEIATENDTSEAASKMRVKRALAKLSRMLTARGATLSATAIASALGGELARAAPVSASSSLASTALAASPVAGAGLLTLTSIEIMTIAKTATATGLAIIALAATPFFLQESSAKRLREELSELQQRRSVAQLAPTGNPVPALAQDRADRPKTIRDLLAGTGQPINVETLFGDLVEAITSQDMVRMLKVTMPLSQLDSAEFAQLMASLEDYPANFEAKQMVRDLLSRIAPNESPEESLDSYLQRGAQTHSYSNLLRRWAQKEPEAAEAWFRKKLASGELVGTAVNDRTTPKLLSELLGGMASSDPGSAVDLYLELGDAAPYSDARLAIGKGLGEHHASGGDLSELRRLLAEKPDVDTRLRVLDGARRTAVDRKDIAGAAAFIGSLVEKRADQDKLVLDHISGSGLSLDQQLDEVREHITDISFDASVAELVQARLSSTDTAELEKWLQDHPSEQIRDIGLSTVARNHSLNRQFQRALDASQKIADLDKRELAIGTFARRWLDADEAAARAALPADVLESIGTPNNRNLQP